MPVNFVGLAYVAVSLENRVFNTHTICMLCGCGMNSTLITRISIIFHKLCIVFVRLVAFVCS